MTGADGAPPKRAPSNLQLRIVSSAVLAVVVLGPTWLGGMPFRLLAAAIGALVLYEWVTMAGAAIGARERTVAAVFLALSLAALLAGSPAIMAWALLAAGVAVLMVLERAGGKGRWTAPGLLYAGAPALSLALLRGGDHAGLLAVLFLFAVVWATDILAYFVGRTLGGPKLAPSISPGKTWSGAIGGTAGGMACGLAVALLAGHTHPALLLGASLVLSVVSQIGDLFESWVKRRHGVKDSSRLIPGHGGVMDRVDGLAAAAVALYLVGLAAGGGENPAQALFVN